MACSTTAHPRATEVGHVSPQCGVAGGGAVPHSIMRDRYTTTMKANRHTSADHRPRWEPGPIHGVGTTRALIGAIIAYAAGTSGGYRADAACDTLSRCGLMRRE